MSWVQFALVALGRNTEAPGENAESVRLIPEFADLLLNYGVALARNGRYVEAAAEFRETLRLSPQDERAQRMLEQVKRERSLAR